MTHRTALAALLLTGLACSGMPTSAPPSSDPAATQPPAGREGKAGKRGKRKGRAGQLDPVADWARTDSVEFGCMLAEAGGAVDAKWACGAPTAPEGDPCKDTDDYTAGPKFPDALLAKLSVQATRVDLSWEHTALQSVSIQLAPGIDGATARKALGLDGTLPSNVQSVDVQDCGKGVQCLEITGFDHMGAGDVDCGDGE